MASFNKITIVGHLGQDPEQRYTPTGKAVTSFSMATTEKRQNDEEITTWFRVTLWGRQAELASEHLTKGQQVYIEGRLTQRQYEKSDGSTGTSLEVNGTDMRFLGSK